MVAAAYTHDTSRNLDPQLHTHLLIANMTEYAGKWKALATDYIHNAGFIETVMKHQVTLGKIYRSALREQVESLGHEVEETGKNGSGRLRVFRKRSGKNTPPVAGKFRGQWGQKPRCAAGMWPRKTRAAQRSIRPGSG
jgi:hypothetical protein